MHLGGPASRPRCKTRGALLCGALVLLFSATFARGQDVAEAARLEQAHKASQPKTARHVYTDEDLRRQKILTPEYQAQVEARKKQRQPAPAGQNAEQLPNGADPQSESLGGAARRYRHEQAARSQEQAEKKKFSPFPFQIPHGSLAAPNPRVAPRVDRSLRLDLREPIGPLPLLAPRAMPPGPVSHSGVSPFQPRPFAAAPPNRRVTPSVAPVAPPSDLHAPSAVPRIPHGAPVNPRLSLGSAGLQRVQVHRGESWWKLAERYLGDGTRWQELRKLNGEPGPSEFLRLGSIVLVPEKAGLREASPKRSIKVRKGDSLWSLAREYLGHGSAWKCLAEANPQLKDYIHMAIDSPLELPTGQSLGSCQVGNIDKIQR